MSWWTHEYRRHRTMCFRRALRYDALLVRPQRSCAYTCCFSYKVKAVGARSNSTWMSPVVGHLLTPPKRSGPLKTRRGWPKGRASMFFWTMGACCCFRALRCVSFSTSCMFFASLFCFVSGSNPSQLPSDTLCASAPVLTEFRCAFSEVPHSSSSASCVGC